MMFIWTSISECQYSLEVEWIVSSPAEKYLMILLHEKLDVNWQCALETQKTKHILDCKDKKSWPAV